MIAAPCPDERDMAVLWHSRWHLLRDISRADEVEDWCDGYVSVPDTGQGSEAALAQLLELTR